MRIIYTFDTELQERDSPMAEFIQAIREKNRDIQNFLLPVELATPPVIGNYFCDSTNSGTQLTFLISRVEYLYRENYVVVHLILDDSDEYPDQVADWFHDQWFHWHELEDWAEGRISTIPTK